MKEINNLLKEYDKLKMGCSIEDWHNWTTKARNLFIKINEGQTTLWDDKQ